jgi:DNA-3-methyladenine glycosylase II
MATGLGTNDWAPRLPAIDTVTSEVVVGDEGLDELPQPAQMAQIAEHWRPYRTLACRYLWRSLQNEPT